MQVHSNRFVGETNIEEALSLSATQLRDEICRSKVMVLRCPSVSVSDFSEFMLRLGRTVNHVLEQYCLPAYRHVLTISNLYRDGRSIGVHEGGGYWHTDMSYARDNILFTGLHAAKVPNSGGETEFIDCEAALEMVTGAIRNGHLGERPRRVALDKLLVEHRFGNRERLRNADASEQWLDDDQVRSLDEGVWHPLVLRHPIIGSRSLYAVCATSRRISGWSKSESVDLLDAIFDYVLAHAPRYTHRYREGDIVVWDNVSTLHCGPNIPRTEDESDCRLLYRINVSYAGSGDVGPEIQSMDSICAAR